MPGELISQEERKKGKTRVLAKESDARDESTISKGGQVVCASIRGKKTDMPQELGETLEERGGEETILLDVEGPSYRRGGEGTSFSPTMQIENSKHNDKRIKGVVALGHLRRRI